MGAKAKAKGAAKPMEPMGPMSLVALRCAQSGDLEGVQAAVGAGADLGARSIGGLSAVHFAAKLPDSGCLAWLIGPGRADPEARSLAGRSPLMAAAEAGSLPCARLLLSCPRVDPGAADSEGYTALMFASIESHLECVDALLATGRAEPAAREAEGGKNAYMHAAAWGAPECVERLAPWVDCAERDVEGRDAVAIARMRASALGDPESQAALEQALRAVALQDRRLLDERAEPRRAAPKAARI